MAYATATDPLLDLLIPRLEALEHGRFTHGTRLAESSEGTAVFQFKDRSSGELAVIKIIDPARLTLMAAPDQERALAQLKTAAQAGLFLERRKVAVTPAILGFDDEGIPPLLITSHVAGTRLEAYVGQHANGRPPQLTPDRLMGPVLAMARALEQLHGAQVVHGDLHPGHVILQPVRGTPGGYRATLLDLGRATFPGGPSPSGRTTGWGLQFLSPEGVGGDRAITAASDIYALGVMAYQALTGWLPFEEEVRGDMKGAAASEVMRECLQLRVYRPQPPSPTDFNTRVSPELAALILAMVHRDPQERPSATEVVRELAAIASGRPSKTRLLAALPIAAAAGAEPTHESATATVASVELTSPLDESSVPMVPLPWLRWAALGAIAALLVLMTVGLYRLTRPKPPSTDLARNAQLQLMDLPKDPTKVQHEGDTLPAPAEAGEPAPAIPEDPGLRELPAESQAEAAPIPAPIPGAPNLAEPPSDQPRPVEAAPETPPVEDVTVPDPTPSPDPEPQKPPESPAPRPSTPRPIFDLTVPNAPNDTPRPAPAGPSPETERGPVGTNPSSDPGPGPGPLGNTSGPPILAFNAHESQVWSLDISRDGRQIATGGVNENARRWDISNGHDLGPLTAAGRDHENWVIAVSFSPDGRYLATGSEDTTVKVWGTGAGQPLIQTIGKPSDPVVVRAMVFSPTSDTLFIGYGNAGGTIKIFDLGTKSLRPTSIANRSAVRAMAVSPDGKTLATGGDDGIARLWNIGSGDLRTSLTANSGWIQAVAFNKRGQIATGHGDGKVRIWSTEGPLLRTFGGHRGGVYSLSFRPTDGLMLASGGADGEIHLWDVRDGSAHGTLTGHAGTVTALVFTPDGTRLVTGSHQDHPGSSAAPNVRIWKIN